MRRRMIDPAFWNDSKIIELSYEARLFYIGLWNYADDEGFFIDDLPAVKRTLFPDQKFDIHGVFSECSCFLKRYKYKGENGFAYQIVHFLEWQTINRPSPSKIKPFCEFTDNSVSAHGGLTLKLSKDKLKEGVSDDSVNECGSEVRVSKNQERPIGLLNLFWDHYPNKNGKGAVEKIWAKLKPDEAMVDLMVKAIAAQKLWRENANGRFRPEWKNPATWLNQRCWEDEPELPDVAPPEPKIQSVKDGIVYFKDGTNMRKEDYEREYQTRI